MDEEHIKRVFAHQDQQKLLLEVAERMIAIENRIAKLDERTRERLEAFMEGAKRLNVRHEQLENKLEQTHRLLGEVQKNIQLALTGIDKHLHPYKEFSS